MHQLRTSVLACLIVLAGGATFAAQAQSQSVDTTTQRDANQQNRIEQGLQSGQLNTREAGKLERGETRIDRTEQRDMRNGSLSAGEQAHLDRMQNHESGLIYGDKHDTSTGNPNSASSQRMQNDVQRNANQEQRIANGTASGQLTNHEAGRLEGREAHVDHTESSAARNGYVGAREQGRVQRTENRDSGRVFRQKHNGRRG